MAVSPRRMDQTRDDPIASLRADLRTAWLRRPRPLLALGPVALAPLAAFAAWPWLHGADATPKRWTYEKETSLPCFNTLVTATSPPTAECFHRETEPIPPRLFDWSRPHVAVYSTAAPPHASPSLRDLGDQGQAEAIRFLEKDVEHEGAVWADLQKALDDSTSAVAEHDPFRFDRVLVANVAQGVDWEPGDRMVWTRVLVEPINFAFAGYSVAETDNETLKVTSVERRDSRKFSADLTATIPGMEGPKADVGPSSEHSVKTSADINAQYEKLGVDIMPGFLRIMRESETGGDAVGNTKVALTAVTNPEMIWKRYPKDRPQHSDDDPIVLLVTGTHFDGDRDRSADDKSTPAVDIRPEVRAPHCALRARVWMLYEERHIDSGRESYDESKQNVTMVHDAEDKQDVDVVSADEVSPAAWSLKLCENAQCAGDEGRVLRAAVEPALPGPQNALLWRKVVFTDYAVAFRLAHWLKTHQTPPNASYRFNYPDADGSAVSLLPIKTDKDECQAQEANEVSRR